MQAQKLANAKIEKYKSQVGPLYEQIDKLNHEGRSKSFSLFATF